MTTVLAADQTMQRPGADKTGYSHHPGAGKRFEVCELARSAERKLVKEAKHQDLDLRLLVGHANLLDHLQRGVETRNATCVKNISTDSTPLPDKMRSSNEHISDSNADISMSDWVTMFFEKSQDIDSDSDDELTSSSFTEDDTDEDEVTLVRTTSSKADKPPREANNAPINVEIDAISPSEGSLKLGEFSTQEGGA